MRPIEKEMGAHDPLSSTSRALGPEGDPWPQQIKTYKTISPKIYILNIRFYNTKIKLIKIPTV